MNDDIVAKLNDAAAQLRQATQSLGTDYLSRQSVPGPGHVVLGTGAQALGLLPPDKPDGSVLTLDSQAPSGVRWGTGGTGEVDSDEHGNVWEGPSALQGGRGTENTAMGGAALFGGTEDPASSVAIGSGAMNHITGNSSNDVVVGAHALASATTHDVENLVVIGYRAMAGVNIDGGGSGGIAIGAEANSSDVLPGLGHNGSSEIPGDFIAIGFQAIAQGNQSVAIGVGAQAVKTGGTAMGSGALADGAYCLALGSSTEGGTSTTDAGCVAIGTDSSGLGAQAFGTNMITLGTSNHHTRIPGIPVFTFGDKYLVVNSSGDIHQSALGPAS